MVNRELVHVIKNVILKLIKKNLNFLKKLLAQAKLSLFHQYMRFEFCCDYRRWTFVSLKHKVVYEYVRTEHLKIY